MPIPFVPGNAPILTATGSKRGIVVYCHGLDNPAAHPIAIPGGAVGTLTTGLQTDGWNVLYATIPCEYQDAVFGSQGAALFFDVNNDAGFGSRQLNSTILPWWDHVVLWIKATYGNWPILLVGTSWGGYVNMAVAIGRTSTIIGYAPIHPISVLSKISPGTSVANSSGLDISNTGLNGIGNGFSGNNPYGLLTWGTTDTTVDFPNSGDLLTPAIASSAAGAGQNVLPNCNGSGAGNSSGGTPEGHPVSVNDANSVLAWVTATIDPHYPKVF
jgi:hypothetical protein